MMEGMTEAEKKHRAAPSADLHLTCAENKTTPQWTPIRKRKAKNR